MSKVSYTYPPKTDSYYSTKTMAKILDCGTETVRQIINDPKNKLDVITLNDNRNSYRVSIKSFNQFLEGRKCE